MNVNTGKPLLARTPTDRFVGRESELESLYLRIVSGGSRPAVKIAGPVGAGVSELLRQLYDRLFYEQRFVVPFYFAVDANDGEAKSAASRYLYQFLLQSIAFRRQEPELIAASPDICELANLAPLPDTEWVNRICEVCLNEGPLNDERAFIRSAVGAPFRERRSANFRVHAIVDDLHEADLLTNGRFLTEELASVANRAASALIVASNEGRSLSGFSGEGVKIERLDRHTTAKVVDRLASVTDVRISDETRDLIAVQFGGRPKLIELFLFAAKAKNRSLDQFRDVESLYTEELLSGSIGAYFDQMMTRSTRDRVLQGKLFEAFYIAIASENAEFPIESLREKLTASDENFERIVKALSATGIIEVENTLVRLSPNVVLQDYLLSRRRPAESKRTSASISAYTVTKALKRAPKMMSRVYRREAAFGLIDLLSTFDLQNVPRVLFDYGSFRDKLKGLSDEEISDRIAVDEEKLALPQIAHSASVFDHLPEFGEPIEPERVAVGVGFINKGYRDEDEIAWFAAEIDSKLEADLALTREWCERLEKAADAIGYANCRIWLIAPEGFSDGALGILAERNYFGSSRKQAELLRRYLSDGGDEASGDIREFEMTIPVGDETELIAAHAFDEIARKFDLPVKSVNQIKTALVEACINAGEHSLSPDNKIHQKFTIDDKRIIVTVSNRGLRLIDRIPAEMSGRSEEGRRGWGLGLIRSLMDEVRVEPVDDGTRIVMTKYR